MISNFDNANQKEVANIFNSHIAATAIAASWELGLLDAVRDEKALDIRKFAAEHDLHYDSIDGMVAALATCDIVERQQDRVVAGRLMDEAYRTKSLFHWLTLGSGALFSRMQHVVRNKNRKGDYYNRDPAAIAYACREANREFFDPAFWKAMDKLHSEGHQFHSAVDLGSGSGERLMQILEKYPGTTAVGVDIASPAIEFAKAEASRRGLADRLSFVVGDARELSYQKEFAQVDVLTCFMMGHDFWPRENCIKTLRMLRDAFPEVRRFFLADTTRILLDTDSSETELAVDESDVPVFTLGFEFGHAMMDTFIPTKDQWEAVFEEGGWRCLESNLIMPPSASVLFELEPIRTG